MRISRFLFTALTLTCALQVAVPVYAKRLRASGKHPHNVIVFVADGLRAESVNPTIAPTISSIRDEGVNFANSHSVFPTFTTSNGAAIATGHAPGDTSIFSNVLFTGYPTFFPLMGQVSIAGMLPGTMTPNDENDPVLADLDFHFNGNFINEDSLLSLARQNGYDTAAVGKLGP